MALRDQPYIPLMVKDWLTDEKLKECSAASLGVYLYIMCAMHKSKEYGTILLKQKNKQTNDQIENFALKLQKHMHFPLTVIYDALIELIYEDVLQLDVKNNKILQKRMIKDNRLSIIRSESGSKGGKKTQLALAKKEANTVTANVIVNKDVIPYKEIIEDLNNKLGKNYKATDKHKEKIKARFNEGHTLEDFKTVHSIKIKEWKGTENAVHLKPLTLYGNKFNGYLNQPDAPIKSNVNKIDNSKIWNQILSLINKYGKNNKPKLDENTEKIIKLATGWSNLCDMKEMDSKFKVFAAIKEINK